jgi:hypothetical protein
MADSQAERLNGYLPITNLQLARIYSVTCAMIYYVRSQLHVSVMAVGQSFTRFQKTYSVPNNNYKQATKLTATSTKVNTAIRCVLYCYYHQTHIILRVLTAMVRVKFQSSPYGICGDKKRHWDRIFLTHRNSLPVSFHQC